ncbi:hypothetical protein SELR_pSRC102380 (plasmid) [Selenomonas ruminantium subsp. lactilytica TAM6421]|uniref:DUF2779 domain-containing protein n=1 Tax=Selenomonas ruminantium subsp. lactilytica (strain NBRC 103574 / TAM6421) TaxID=927704 RepID=I0GWA8_SELRL|nr:DUF2779 domain-containing protein [Selenomonas ruminantium]BAL85045.1 hypothetical protein SELR_pSRC102380 [Selenomonas ruminantium subsp. lactilytica TAM6421]
MAIDLSKSRYCEGLQCPKRVWLRKYNEKAYDESYNNQALFNEGTAVGKLARGLFGDFSEIAYNDDRKKMAQDTQIELKKGASVIAEASFFVDKLFCSVDILRILEQGKVELYEVKASKEVKPIYLQDISFQCYVLTKAGFEVQKACLVHIDNTYVRGDELDIQQLFKIVDLTEHVLGMQDTIKENIAELACYMEEAGENEPSTDIGLQCFAVKNTLHTYDCPYFTYCSKGLEKPNVFDIHGMKTKTKVKYYKGGYCSFAEVLPELTNATYKQQVDYELNNKGEYIDQPAMKDFLSQFHYPLYFLDFETINPAIPRYKGTKPYQMQVFQYSLHILDSEDAELKHIEYLGNPHNDSRKEIAQRICQEIPPRACIVAYNASFESTRIRELAEAYPEMRERLLEMTGNFVDMMQPFKARWYYRKEFKGSYSIKEVLPALCPNDSDLNYENLQGVHKGNEASAIYLEMAEDDCENIEEKRQQLLKYCKLDTLGMIKILEVLKEKVNPSSVKVTEDLLAEYEDWLKNVKRIKSIDIYMRYVKMKYIEKGIDEDLAQKTLNNNKTYNNRFDEFLLNNSNFAVVKLPINY